MKVIVELLQIKLTFLLSLPFREEFKILFSTEVSSLYLLFFLGGVWGGVLTFEK